MPILQGVWVYTSRPPNFSKDHPSVKVIVDEAVKDHVSDPRFPIFYPRVYDSVPGYPSPKRIAAYLSSIGYGIADSVDYHARDRPQIYGIAYRPICDMVRHKMPSYFVEPDLLAATDRTKYQEHVDWNNMTMPFEAGTLVLPTGSFVHPIHGTADWIGWGRMKAHIDYTIPGFPQVSCENNSVVFFTCCEDLTWLYFILIAGKSPCPAPLETLVPSSPKTDLRYPGAEPIVESDTDFLHLMVKRFYTLLFIMRARPEIVEPGKLRKVVKRGAHATEFWTPTMLGRNYRIRVEKSSPHGTDTRDSYWVGGHGKMQTHGPRNSLRKEIFIDPYYVDTGHHK